MGLIDLKSDLAANRFGEDVRSEDGNPNTFGEGRAYDRPDKEFSMEPFVKGGIELGGTSVVNTVTGGFIRGGALMHIERLLQDTARFGMFLLSARGVTWSLKELGLHKSNPKISKPSYDRGHANQRTWSFGINTLAQIVGQGTGLHIKKEGASPLAHKGYIDDYTKIGMDYVPPKSNDYTHAKINE